jgi:hypothetical protein
MGFAKGEWIDDRGVSFLGENGFMGFMGFVKGEVNQRSRCFLSLANELICRALWSCISQRQRLKHHLHKRGRIRASPRRHSVKLLS